MSTRFGLLAVALLLVLPASAQQKRALDHSDYPRWRTISGQRLSTDGNWAVWREAPDTIGDGRVVIRDTDSDTEFVIRRGDDPRFAGGFVVATVHPPYDSTRQAKVDGKKGDELPKNQVAVIRLRSGDVTSYGPTKSFRVPADRGAFAAILFDEETETERDSTVAESPHDKKDGDRLSLLNLEDGTSIDFESVIDYRFTDDGEWLVYAAESKSGAADGVYAVRTRDGTTTPIMMGEGFYRQLALSDDGEKAAFVANTDDFDADQPTFTLYAVSLGDEVAQVATEGTSGLPAGWWVSEHGSLDFSDSGTRLYFGNAPRPAPEVDDDRPEDEKVAVDVWSWTDKDLMTVQLVNRNRDLQQSYRAVAHLEDATVVQLADETVETIDDLGHGDGAVVLGTDRMRYMPESSWDTPAYRDVYAIDVSTGTKTLILEGIRSGMTPSPSGSHLAWWDGENRVWKITGWSTQPNSVVTSTIAPPPGVRFENELHDSPAIPGSNGPVGWTDDERWFLFYDRFDIWAAQPNGRTWQMTDGNGRAAGLRYRNVRLDPDARTVNLTEPLLFSVFDENDKSSGFARAEVRGSGITIDPIVMEPVRFSNPIKAEDGDELLLSRQSYTEFPDLWITDRRFEDWNRLSNANPHQVEYLWGTAELVRWTSTDGQRLDGILYKPEGFDPSEQYPMMVYFYEKSSSGLHAYHAPAPGRSVINRTFYASRGYLVFVPDIPYKDGYPGESAMNAVMPGVTGLIDRGFVDRERIGVQGHSWGGYQIAYMVTRTDLFAAAEAGAPVSNMISAYGGIRWQTGLSRMFQYERTQSRIGGTIWEKPLRYIENSPIFWLDKVETPLLIMHNDSDGHVPWYQGIELFVALRRLGKPSWLINYNDEPHWPLPYWKRVDWTKRLQQFFDHYLMEAPAPKWLDEGLPAVLKGRDWGLELPASDRH